MKSERSIAMNSSRFFPYPKTETHSFPYFEKSNGNTQLILFKSDLEMARTHYHVQRHAWNSIQKMKRMGREPDVVFFFHPYPGYSFYDEDTARSRAWNDFNIKEKIILGPVFYTITRFISSQLAGSHHEPNVRMLLELTRSYFPPGMIYNNMAHAQTCVRSHLRRTFKKLKQALYDETFVLKQSAWIREYPVLLEKQITSNHKIVQLLKKYGF